MSFVILDFKCFGAYQMIVEIGVLWVSLVYYFIFRREIKEHG